MHMRESFQRVLQTLKSAIGSQIWPTSGGSLPLTQKKVRALPDEGSDSAWVALADPHGDAVSGPASRRLTEPANWALIPCQHTYEDAYQSTVFSPVT